MGLNRRRSIGFGVAFGIGALLLAAMGTQRLAAQEVGPATLQDAWARTEKAGRYQFETRLAQTNLPAARITAIGQKARTQTIFAKGVSDRAKGQLELMMWDNPAVVNRPENAIEVRIEGLQAYGRTSKAGDWKPLGEMSTAFAPSGDAAAFLSAAENVVFLGRDRRELPTANGGTASITYDRYRFTLNGDQYADTLRRQMQEQLQRSGDLPAGMKLNANDQFRRMVSVGEAWIDSTGLPVRLTLDMEYPLQANGERVKTNVTTTFLGFEDPPKSGWGGELSQLGDRLSGAVTAIDWRRIAFDAGLPLLVMLIGLSMIVWRPKRAAKPIAAFLALQMAIVPLGSDFTLRQMQRLYEKFPQLTGASQADKTGQDENPAPQADPTPAFDTSRPPLAQALRSATDEKTPAAVPTRPPLPDANDKPAEPTRGAPGPLAPLADGPDADEDGLEDSLEATWDTSATAPDSDGDGLSDGREVELCPARSAYSAGTNLNDPVCSDPYFSDTDLDDLTDGEEVLYLGTLPQQKDSDLDGITDGAEVKGFLMPDNITRRWSDPRNPDSDGDGILDGVECPALRRTTTTPDYRGSASGNSPWTNVIKCNDTDADGTPDIFDLDSDNDNVPDGIDNAPTRAFGLSAPFNRTQPLNLRLEDLSANRPVMVDFQIRPVVPEHLSYALNVLDWPSGDFEGQIQRDRATTFGDATGGDDRSFRGDMRLTPMLEITLPGDTLDLPRTTPSATIPLRTGGKIMGTVALQPNDTALTLTLGSIAGILGAVSITKGTCSYSTPVWAIVGTAGQSFVQNAKLADYANGGHVMSLVLDSQTYCTPIPKLVKGTAKLTILFQEPVQAFGTLQMTQSGSPTFKFNFSAAGAYSATVSSGSCDDSGAVSFTLPSVTPATPIVIPTSLVSVVDGAHIVRLKRAGETILCEPLGNIVNGSNPTLMIDATKLASFQINVSENADGTLAAFVPLGMAVDAQSGKTEAFHGRMFYQHNTSAPISHTVNLVWLVTVLSDYCPEANCSNPGSVLDQPRVVHQFRDESWVVTGLGVTEELGVDVALVYQDPATATDSAAERDAHLIEWNDNLWHLANGLQRIFIQGVDCDAGNTATCAGTPNGQRDLKVFDIKTRWDIGAGATITQRWGIPADALNVVTSTFAHPGDLGVLAESAIPAILNQQFMTGVYPFTSMLGAANTVIFPTILVASETRSRAAGAALTENVTFAGRMLKVDFDPGQIGARIEPVTSTAMSWKPFRHGASKWEPMPLADYWDYLDKMLPLAGSFSKKGDRESEYAAAADIRMTQVAYVNLYAGIGKVVEALNQGGTYLLSSVEEGEATTDSELAYTSDVIKASGETTGGFTKAFLEPFYEVWDFEHSLIKRLQKAGNQRMIARLDYTVKGSIGRGVRNAIGSFTGFDRLFDSAKNATFKGRVGGVGSALTSSAAQLMVGLAKSLASIDSKNNNTQQVVVHVLQGIATAQAIGDGVKMLHAFSKLKAVVGETNLGALSKLGDSLATSSKAAKVTAVVGLVFELSVSFAIFVYQVNAAGLTAFSLAMNQALSQWAAGAIVAVMMAALASTGVGAIIVAIIGLIDSVISLFCGIYHPDEDEDVAANWACKGLSGILTEGVAYVIYDTTDIIDLNNPNRLKFKNFNPYLADPKGGFAAGAPLQMDLQVENTIKTQSFDSPLSFLYGWQFNEKNTRSATFAYDLVAADEKDESKQLHNGVELGGDPTGWIALGGDQYRRTVNLTAPPGRLTLPAAGINAQVAAYLAEGYASPTQECFMVPNIIPPWFPPVIPICHERSRNASNYLDLNLVYDVFPSTLSAFYSLTPHYVGYGLAWGQAGKVKFRTLQDADGDGLDITVDPNDSLFDTDGDTVTDLKEVQIGTDPTRADTDSDGLNDREELRFGSNPLTNDTDGDGLTDDLERVGWSIGYNYINGVAGVSWTYPDPELADADDDNIFDLRERALGSSPFASSDGAIVRYEANLRETDSALLLMRFDEGSNAETFAESSGSTRTERGSCSEPACPVTGVNGLAVNAAYFDGNDVVVLPYMARINGLKTGFSISAWVKADNLTGRHRILSIARTQSVNGFSFGIDNGNLLFTAYGLADFNGTALSAIPLGVWTHVGVAVAQNGSNTEARFFVDTALKETITRAIPGVNVSPNDKVLLGAGTVVQTENLDEPWVGHLDEVAVYGQVLDSNGMFRAYYSLVNLDDATLTAQAPVLYETELESKLLVRNIEGVLQTNVPGFLSGASTARNIMVSPRQVLPTNVQTLTFNTAPASGAYTITQSLGAIVDVPYKPETGQDVALVYRNSAPLGFEGKVSDRREVADNANYNLSSTDFTLSFWLQPDPFAISYVRGVMGHRSGEIDAYPSIQQIGTTLRFGYGTGSAWVVRDLANAIPNDGNWHHYVVSFVRNNGGNAIATVYVDNVLEGTLNFFTDRPGSALQRFDIGRSSQTARFRVDKFDLFCEADGIGNGEYNFNYWNPKNSTNSLYWAGAGTDGASFSIPTGWREFEDNIYLSVCENDPDDSDQTTCDGDDELMIGTDYSPWKFMSTAEQSYADAKRTVSTLPTSPGTCGFWTGYNDTGTFTYTFENNSVPYIGDLKDFRLYRRALSQSDVTNVYQSNTVIARFKMDERPAARQFADDLARVTAVCSGTSCPVTGLPGRDNVGIRFDGVNDYLTADAVSGLAYSAAISTNFFAFGGWIKPDMDFGGPGTEQYIFSFNGANYDNRLLLGIVADPGDPSDQYRIRFYDGNQTTSSLSYPRDQWLHLWLDVNRNFVGEDKLFVNGSVIKVFTTTALPDPNGRFSIGQEWDSLGVPSNFFKGMVDEVAILPSNGGAPSGGAYEYARAPEHIRHMDSLAEAPGARTNFDPVEDVGQVYGGYAFNGQNQYLNSSAGGERLVTLDPGFSVMGWVKPRNTTGNGSPTYRPIFGAILTGTIWMGLVDGKPTLYNTAGQFIAAPQALPSNQWSHVAFQRDASALRIYVNGTLAASAIPAGLPLNYLDDYGKARNPGSATLSYFDGTLDEFNFTRRPVSADQVRALYNYQATWVDEARRTPFIVDVTAPRVQVATGEQWLPMITTTLLITAADDHSPVVSALYFYRDSRSLDLGSRFPPKCSDGSGGTTFCGLFEPQAEGRYIIDAYAMDAAGNLGWAGSQYRYVYVDATGPTATLNPRAPTPFRATSVADAPARWTIPFSGTVADPLLADGYPSSGVAGVRVRLIDANGREVGLPAEQVATVSGGAWSIDYVVAADDPSGVYSGTLIAEDTVKNKTYGAIPPFTVDNTDPSSVVTGYNAPPAALVAMRGPSAAEAVQVAQYLNASSSLAGSVNERPDTAPTLSSVAGVSAVEVAFEPILGTAYVNRSMPFGTVLYLPFDENNAVQGVTDTTFLDVAGGYTVTCAPNTCPVAAIATRNGQGVSFNGVNSRLSRGVTPGVTNLTSFGAGAWIKLNTVTGTQYIVGTDRAASPNNGWAFGVSDGKLRVEMFGVANYESPVLVKPDVWYHVAVDLTPNDVYFYVNGDYLASASRAGQPGVANTDDPLVIGGALTATPRPLSGIIDELYVSNGYIGTDAVRAMMGEGPTLHVTFDKAPISIKDNFKEVGGMDVEAYTLFGGGASDFSTPGIAGAFGVQFGPSQALEVSARVGQGVLPSDDGPWTAAFWLRGAGTSLFYIAPNETIWPPPYYAQFSAVNRTLTHGFGGNTYVAPLASTEGWNHYAIVWSGGQLRTYQNGVLRHTAVPPAPIINQAHNWLGVYEPTPSALTAVDDLRIYRRALSGEELSGMARTGWVAASINAAGAGISATTWLAGIPPKLEGFYAVKSRGRDAAGNLNEEPLAAWSGMVDTLPPRLTLETIPGGITTYILRAADFSVDVDAVTLPAACGGNTTSTPTYYGSPWYLGLQPQDSRLAEPRLVGLELTCEISGQLPANATFTVCDRLGNCATVDINGNPPPITPRGWLPRIVR